MACPLAALPEGGRCGVCMGIRALAEAIDEVRGVAYRVVGSSAAAWEPARIHTPNEAPPRSVLTDGIGLVYKEAIDRDALVHVHSDKNLAIRGGERADRVGASRFFADVVFGGKGLKTWATVREGVAGTDELQLQWSTAATRPPRRSLRPRTMVFREHRIATVRFFHDSSRARHKYTDEETKTDHRRVAEGTRLLKTPVGALRPKLPQQLTPTTGVVLFDDMNEGCDVPAEAGWNDSMEEAVAQKWEARSTSPWLSPSQWERWMEMY